MIPRRTRFQINPSMLNSMATSLADTHRSGSMPVCVPGSMKKSQAWKMLYRKSISPISTSSQCQVTIDQLNPQDITIAKPIIMINAYWPWGVLSSQSALVILALLRTPVKSSSLIKVDSGGSFSLNAVLRLPLIVLFLLLIRFSPNESDSKTSWSSLGGLGIHALTLSAIASGPSGTAAMCERDFASSLATTPNI